MKKQAIVIGLGQFGSAVARSLTSEGVEVIVVDRRQELVQEASSYAVRAICADATDEQTLAALNPGARDMAISAIGNESREGSIIVTALLRQLGCPFIVARATDRLLERILQLVGAHEVVNPEQEFGERYAKRLAHQGLLEEIPLSENLVITEMKVLPFMANRTLAELKLPKQYGIMVLGIKTVEEGVEHIALPGPERPLNEQESLLVVGRPGSTRALLKEQ
ncbi:MAG: TrkA family potassium uptake protein [Acidobacteria bacterium]|nr:TrkA family potassium uptake protein [Acidobacteriota bacterium]